MTSHDVINRLRRKYHQKKFGHTGTLDPDATGVLVITCGKATKILQFLDDTDKTYRAEIQLGYRTTTDDISGDIIEEKEIHTDYDFETVLKSFEGPLHQKVPMTSNKKVNGKKLIDYQREGKDVPDVYQDVEIYSIKSIGELAFEVHCSSGTYVRSICRDFGYKTGNLACMKSLCRTQVGRFTLEQAQHIDEEPVLYPAKLLLSHLEQIALEDCTPVYQGKPLKLDTNAQRVLILDKEEPIAIYDRFGDVYRSKRGLW